MYHIVVPRYRNGITAAINHIVRCSRETNNCLAILNAPWYFQVETRLERGRLSTDPIGRRNSRRLLSPSPTPTLISRWELGAIFTLFVQGTRENRFKEIKFRQVLKIFSQGNAARRALGGIYRTTRLCSGNNEASFVFPKGKKIASKISSGFVRITSFILILENDIKISIDFGLRRILKSIKFFQRYRDELILWLRMNKNNIKLSKSKSCIFLDNYMRLATMTENH